MDEIRFTVPSIPIAQPRQRHRVAFAGGKAFARNYTPANAPVNFFKAAVQMAAAKAYSGPPLAGPLCVDLTFVFPRPKSKVWKKRDMPRLWHTGKPDRDNIIKSFQDALNGLLWVDDAQICAGEVFKYVASGEEQPHVEVRVLIL